MSVADLAAANGIADPSRITVGQRIRVGTAIPLTSTPRATQNAVATQQAAGGNRPVDVTIASGRNVAVGTLGTSQDGRYVYQVQADGSVKNLTTGRTTSPPANGNGDGGGSGIGTHWDSSAGGWVGGGQ
jgi:hypothetical protein